MNFVKDFHWFFVIQTFGDGMRLFLFIFMFCTYFHSITFIQNTLPSPFVDVPLNLLWGSVGKTFTRDAETRFELGPISQRTTNWCTPHPFTTLDFFLRNCLKSLYHKLWELHVCTPPPPHSYLSFEGESFAGNLRETDTVQFTFKFTFRHNSWPYV